MFCTQSGGGLADDAKFCTSCGAPVGPRVPPASGASAPPPFVAPVPAASAAEQNASGQTFVLNQKLISMTGDLWIDDSNGNHAFEVDGKLLAMRRSLLLKDTSGQELYEINKSLAHVRKSDHRRAGVDRLASELNAALADVLAETLDLRLGASPLGTI